MFPLAFAWLCAAAFAASLTFFLYSYFVLFDAGGPAGPILANGIGSAVFVNVALFTGFALHHSVFARTGVKDRIRAVVPSLERAFYTLVSSVLFALVCLLWQPVPGVLYRLDGLWQILGYLAVAAGLVLTALGAGALDVLDLAGVRQALDARSPSAERSGTRLKTDGVYALVRHPVYFGWILIVFGVPEMTLTRLVFAVVSTAYLAVAVPFEERSLIETFGAEYASYRRKVRWRMLPGLY